KSSSYHHLVDFTNTLLHSISSNHNNATLIDSPRATRDICVFYQLNGSLGYPELLIERGESKYMQACTCTHGGRS
ncbi:hypothetical protein BDW22DRAFT_1359310, partial [Trametopsis cervina]